MDKMLVIIIIFLAVSFLMAAILAMGAVPKIFQTDAKVDQALIQKHEDEAREAQKFQIVTETNKSLNQSITTLENRLYKFMNESQTRSEKGQQERQKIIDEILNVSSQHDKVAKDHDIILIEAQNTTNHVEEELYRYGENSVEKLNKIVENQEKIVKLLERLGTK
jgi:hypothetical protein